MMRLNVGCLLIIQPSYRAQRTNRLFFASIAEAFGDRAIGVIFSGYDGDGTAGCKLIKEKGGITFAQDESAEVNSMPASAQASGCVDFVLPPDNFCGADRDWSAFRSQRLSRRVPVADCYVVTTAISASTLGGLPNDHPLSA
jgi:hypothetical protein